MGQDLQGACGPPNLLVVAFNRNVPKVQYIFTIALGGSLEAVYVCFLDASSSNKKHPLKTSQKTPKIKDQSNAPLPSWYGRPNPEDRINRKPKDQIFDRTTE